MGEGTVDNLIDGVDRFFLTSAATKHEDLGDKVILRIFRVVGKMGRRFPLGDHFWDTHWLSATTAKDSTELLSGNGGGRHRQNSLDKIRQGLSCVHYIKSPVNLSTTG
ncbi:MAG TPA: hypothetical protein VGF61_10260 [Candidatus Acidoferrum sp.]